MIPKNILQTYELEYEKLPSHILDCTKQWSVLNPGWNYIYMDSKQREDFVLKYFGEKWLSLFKKCPLGIMKANIWMYMSLYIYGGVYSDIDLLPLVEIDQWIKNEYDLILFSDELEKNDICVNIFIVAANKNHPILKKTIDDIYNILIDFDNTQIDEYTVFKTTAEPIFRKSINSIIDPNNTLSVLDSIDRYNELPMSRNHKVYYYSGDYTYNVFREKMIKNLDASNNWIGYNKWREEAKMYGRNNA